MTQRLLVQNQISPSTASGWDSLINTNTDNLQHYIYTFAITASSPGAGTTSSIEIQLEDAAGNPVTDRDFFLRVQIANSNTVTNATNATVARTGDTTLITSYTSSKDLLVKSSAAGLITLTVTDAANEIVSLNIGPSLLRPLFANYDNYINIDFTS